MNLLIDDICFIRSLTVNSLRVSEHYNWNILTGFVFIRYFEEKISQSPGPFLHCSQFHYVTPFSSGIKGVNVLLSKNDSLALPRTLRL